MWTPCIFLLLGFTLASGQNALSDPSTCSEEITDCTGQRATTWGYGPENGPSTWPTEFPQFCAGTRQSPINIVRADAVVTDPGPIQRSGWDIAMPGTLTNNEHTLVFSFSGPGTKPRISGGRLGTDTFEFLQLHWHWGSDSTKGSEHTVDGKMYPLELHMVHTNIKYGDDFANYPDGIAVLGFFYEVSSTANNQLQDLLESLEGVARSQRKKRRKMGRATVFNINTNMNIRLSQLVNTAGVGDNYWYYPGSLTTPACNEIVLWTNFETTIPISEEQLNVFRSLRDTSGDSFNNNFRPPLPMYGRTLLRRVPATGGGAADTSAALSAGTAGGIVIGAGAVLALSAIAPLVFPQNRRSTVSRGQVSQHRKLNSIEKLLRAGQRMFGSYP